MARLHGPSVDYRGHNSPWLRHQLGSILHPIEEVSTCHQVGAQAEWVELAVNAVTPPGSRDDSKSTMDPRHLNCPILVTLSRPSSPSIITETSSHNLLPTSNSRSNYKHVF